MTKTKSTKRALLVSALALLLCVAMLIGSTYAWFTDSVTSAGNIIKSGTLDVTMEWADGKEAPESATWADASKGAIFDYSKWEPGFVQVRHIKIANEGTLALKYQIKIVANGLVEDLAEVIDVYYADPAVQVANRSDLAAATVLGTLDQVLDDMNTSAAGELPAGEDHTVTIALKMQESAGNEYQDQSIGTDFSVQLVATQATAESDSFDDQYDVDAEYPLVASGKKALNEELTLDFDETNVQIVIPADAYAGNYAKVVTYENLTEENGEYTYAVDFAAELNGEKVDPAFEYEVTLQLPQFINITEITHNGNVIPESDWVYDAFTGEVTFKTNSFSPFEVTYTEVAENPTTEDNKIITGGIFTVNPVTFDETLDDENSEYIAVEYVQDDVKYYMVCERATTIIVGDADDEGGNYFTENKNYTVKLLNDNKLQSDAVKLLNAMDHGTLLILPGTYNETARLEPTTNMDIIGLGDKEDIKLIKVSTTNTGSSHQHLFNCNGNTARAEHIQVTIRNLYLDSTANNGIAKDNGAVQAIRKAMVKCYDLVIKDKGCPFYVNATNTAADGALHSAYMYVENTVVSGNSILSYSGNKTEGANSAYFTHYGLTYSNGSKEYTVNETLSGRDGICYVSNEKMESNDWDW